MGWVADLGSLPAVVAILVVFTVCLLGVIRYVFNNTSKHIVSPFKELISNHIAHLAEEQREDREDHSKDREERKKMRETLDKQTLALGEQSLEFRRLCERLNGKG